MAKAAKPQPIPEGCLRLKGQIYNPVNLTLDEMEEVENLCDVAWADVDVGRISHLRAVAFMFLRREQPTLTLEELGKLTLPGLASSNGSGADAGPPERSAQQKRASAGK